jgi:hypothetical protein
MSNRLPIIGEYPADWPEINARVCAEVGHRCIRCGHPYRKGEHGNGQWSPCDEHCTHGGLTQLVRGDGTFNFEGNLFWSGMVPGRKYAAWRILTVHHLDGNKANCSWWNLLALCQRCHLTVQGNVKPETPWFLEHSDWFKPYAAGFYAKKYEGREITREEAEARRDELLAHERLA